jgi:hypothetical protein
MRVKVDRETGVVQCSPHGAHDSGTIINRRAPTARSTGHRDGHRRALTEGIQ